MSQKFTNIQVGLDEDLEEKISWLVPNFESFHILKKSIDARKRGDIHFVYSLEVYGPGEQEKVEDISLEPVNYKAEPPIIIGSGPAGLFAALRFVEKGVPCKLFEKGSTTNERMKAIAKFWRYGELNKKNNVCFGEGGAGLFSDGKLITRIKSPHIPYVMDRLIRFGAPEEIRYLANPHVGSDRIRRVIPQIRNYLQNNGCEIHFDTEITELMYKNQEVVGVKTEHHQEFYSPHIILACGHSAEGLFQHLHESGVAITGKSFAVGFRVEHPQELINKIQYREHYQHPKLSAANYKLTFNDKEKDLGIYSFCMCPGGYVLSSGTEDWGLVTNGMSNYNRNSAFANAAIVVTVDHNKSFKEDVFGGIKYRNSIERKAKDLVVQAGGHQQLPAQLVSDFFAGKTSALGKVSSPSGAIACRLDNLFSSEVHQALEKAMSSFERKMPGFTQNKALFYAVESRTSCPLQITRDKESLQSISHQGLYPTGEGAGYAGGITSAACDGIKVAEAIMSLY
ncbi:MAG: hypothetical protein KDD58_06520 [Bdellovibrionales bacterium]|nr:hypothetical protein [Bdellovibrionales bacterium]